MALHQSHPSAPALEGRGLIGGPLTFVAAALEEQGAVAAGAVAAGAVPAWLAMRYRDWLDAGHAAQMTYLGRHLEPRFDTTHAGLLPQASVVICAAFAYSDGAERGGLWEHIACHARGLDYHATVRRKLESTAALIEARFSGSRCRATVDSAPVMERSLAAACGVGHIGRSGMLLTRHAGPRVVLGEIVCAGVPSDAAVALQTLSGPSFGECGDCRACRDACPTGAIVADGVVDARRCLSYWTIEATQPSLPAKLARAMTLLFGCDICTAVCPKLSSGRCCLEPAPLRGLEQLSPEDLASMDDERLASLLADTALSRTGLVRLRRNARALTDR